MATYKELHGQAVKDITSDPTTTGELFYNSTTDSFRAVIQSSAWFAQSPTTTQHGDGAGCGTASATLIWGGYAPDNPPVTNATEEFNGTGWTTSGNYGSSLFRTGGAGPQTAALGVAGRTGGGSAANQDDCYKYDGSSWTSTANYPANKNGVGVTGTQTAAIAVGGAPYVDTSFEFDGSSWTSSGTYPVSRGNIRGAGTQTAGIFAGGYDPYSNVATTYNGSTFTAISSINTARGIVNHSGNSGSSVISSGAIPASPYVSNATERWDGSSWTTSPATLTSGGIGGGTGGMSNPAGNTSALLAALRGPPSSYPTNTEEFATSTIVTTPSAFASGGNSSNAYYGRNGEGTQTAGLMFGGTTGGGVVYNKTEEYDGSSWTAGGNLPSVRSNAAAAGTQTAGMANGGYLGNPPGGYTDQSLSYDGSSWSSLPTMASTFSSGAGNGVLTSAIVANGSADQDGVQQYNGSSWTSASNAPFSKTSLTGSGVGANEDDLLVAGGTVPATPAIVATSHIYNGSSWTATNNLVVAREGQFQFGTTSSAIGAGGNKTVGTGDKQTNAMVWDGTTGNISIIINR